MVSGKPSNKKSFRLGKSFNIILVFLCLILVFLGKLDLIAVRNLKAFMSDFLAPITFLFNKPVKEIAEVLEDVKSATSLRDENIRFKIDVPFIEDSLSPFILTIPLQLLAYHVAKERGTDVDQPRNLAKSVTVE